VTAQAYFIDKSWKVYSLGINRKSKIEAIRLQDLSQGEASVRSNKERISQDPMRGSFTGEW